jgi:hypothetical protein
VIRIRHLFAVPRVLAALVAFACVLDAGCGVSSPSTNKVDTFTGTLLVGGTNFHSFTSNGSGEFDVKLTSVTPDATAILTVALGQPSGGTCVPLFGYSALARANNPPTALTGPISKTSYCLLVYDSGYLTQPETYTVTVSHP